MFLNFVFTKSNTTEFQGLLFIYVINLNIMWLHNIIRNIAILLSTFDIGHSLTDNKLRQTEMTRKVDYAGNSLTLPCECISMLAGANSALIYV